MRTCWNFRVLLGNFLVVGSWLFIMLWLFTSLTLTTQSQETTWAVSGTQVVDAPMRDALYYRFSDNQRFYNMASVYLGFVNEVGASANYRYFLDQYNISSPWQDNTLIYYEFYYDGKSGDTECLDTNLYTFRVYHADTNTSEVFCLQSPFELESDLLDGKVSSIIRNPFNDYSILINLRYMIDLKTNQWVDLDGTFPPNPELLDKSAWIGSDNLWWDTRTQLPVAFASVKLVDHAYLVRRCNIAPSETFVCSELARIPTPINGIDADKIVDPSGQNILWTAYEIPADSRVLVFPPSDTINLYAFATNIVTGSTTKIFDAKDYFAITKRIFHGYFTLDAKTLVVGLDVVPDDPKNEETQTVFVNFSVPSYTATLGGTAWLDTNQNGIQDASETVQLANMPITLYRSDGQVVANAITDTNGHYTFTVTAGARYIVGIETPDYQLSPQFQSDISQDSDMNPLTGKTNLLILPNTFVDDTIDIGLSPIVSELPTPKP